MRVWLIDEKQAGSASALEEALRGLQDQLDTGLRLLGTSAFQADLAASMRKLCPISWICSSSTSGPVLTGRGWKTH